MTIYHMINYFFICSFMGYLLECMVLSYENKTPVVNRGFGHGPFCIIYGFGAMGALHFLSPVSGQNIKLYLSALVMATVMELITANLMIRLFGSFWWDYSRKPFNYKGIICLESSLAWGFLGILFFRVLNGFINNLAGMIPSGLEKYVALGLAGFYLTDFIYSFRMELKDSEEEEEPVVGRLKVY